MMVTLHNKRTMTKIVSNIKVMWTAFQRTTQAISQCACACACMHMSMLAYTHTCTHTPSHTQEDIDKDVKLEDVKSSSNVPTAH